MKFFNKKQDVIDIQLTSYGKKKLANGNFKPFYYAFFDDNVVYDASYIGVTEAQNQAQTRILEDMQYLKINPTARGIETKLSEFNDMMFSKNNSNSLQKRTIRDAFSENDVLEIEDYYGKNIQNAPDRETICKYPLGNSKRGTQKAPVFGFKSFGATFNTDKYKNHYTGSGIVEEIPQLLVELKHSAILNRDVTEPLGDKDRFQQFLYPQDQTITTPSPGEIEGVTIGTMVRLEGGFVVLDFKEANVDYLKENFEFEVYEIVTNEKTKEIEDITEELIPLQLKNTSQFVSDDPDESFLHNYLEFSSDDNIPDVFLEAIGGLTDIENSNLNTFEDAAANARASTESTTASPYAGNDQDPEDCS